MKIEDLSECDSTVIFNQEKPNVLIIVKIRILKFIKLNLSKLK